MPSVTEINFRLAAWEERPHELKHYVEMIEDIQKEFTETLETRKLDQNSIKKLFNSLLLEYLIYNATEENYINERRVDELIKNTANGLSDWNKLDEDNNLERSLEDYRKVLYESEFSPAGFGEKNKMALLFNDLKQHIDDSDDIEQVIFIEPRKGGLSSLIFLSEIVRADRKKRNFVIIRPRHLLYRYSKVGNIFPEKRTAFVIDKFPMGHEYDFETLLYQELSPSKVVGTYFVDWDEGEITEKAETKGALRYDITKLLYKMQKARLFGYNVYGDALFYYLLYDFLYINVSENKEDYKRLYNIMVARWEEIDKMDIKVKNGNRPHNLMGGPLSETLESFVETLRKSFITDYGRQIEYDDLAIDVGDDRGGVLLSYTRFPFMVNLDKLLVNKTYNSRIMEKLERVLSEHKESLPVIIEKRKGPLGTLSLGYKISRELDEDIYIYNPRKMNSMSETLSSDDKNIMLFYDLVISGQGLMEAKDAIKKKCTLDEKRKIYFTVLADLKGEENKLSGDDFFNPLYTIDKNDLISKIESSESS